MQAPNIKCTVADTPGKMTKDYNDNMRPRHIWNWNKRPSQNAEWRRVQLNGGGVRRGDGI
jgi:hypothetical protein